MKKIILASGSPRRKELLELMGVHFEIKVSNKEEKITTQNPADVVQELAKMKAFDIAEQSGEPCVVIGADTVVAVNENEILGKPADRKNAFEMIKKIQGREHKVYTGVALLEKNTDGTVNEIVFVEETVVSVVALSDSEIEQYLDTKRLGEDSSLSGKDLYEWQDKAGGYGIQGIFAKYIAGIRGDYYNVMGLPICRLYQELKKVENRKE